DPSPLSDRFINALFQISEVTQVTGKNKAFCSILFTYFGRHRFQSLSVNIRQGNSILGKFQNRLSSDSSGGSCDQNNFTVIHKSLFYRFAERVAPLPENPLFLLLRYSLSEKPVLPYLHKQAYCSLKQGPSLFPTFVLL